MKQHICQLIEIAVDQVKKTGEIPLDIVCPIKIENSRDPKHGDFACNIALLLAKSANKNPRQLAELIIQHIPESACITKTEVAGAGFINFFVSNATQHQIISEILERGAHFGRCDMGKNQRINLEFVSANPTGPLHVGHGRGAAYGSVMSKLLEAVGYEVHSEYYVNDAGRQMDILATSVFLRYLELFGEQFDFPSNGYKGDYIIDIAKEMQNGYNKQFLHCAKDVFAGVFLDESKGGDKEKHIDDLISRAKTLLSRDYKIVHEFGLSKILDDIKNDLEEFGVVYQEWFLESSLFETQALQKGIEALKQTGHTYSKEGALWFKSTDFGDEKDRVLIRDNGQTTYFASDVAYHWNKLQRGHKILIDIWGADHHGYIKRVRSAMEALGLDSSALQVPLVQFVTLLRAGKPVQMSTRSGSFVTLRELREEVGNDATRFFYVMRKAEQHVDFDLDLAKSKTNENPVYYIQYAHARICSVFRQLAEKGLAFHQENGEKALSLLITSHEKQLISSLMKYPEIIQNAAKLLEPHQLTNYLKDVANAFHTYYNANQFLVEQEDLRNARLCLISAARQVLLNGLTILGITTPEIM